MIETHKENPFVPKQNDPPFKKKKKKKKLVCFYSKTLSSSKIKTSFRKSNLENQSINKGRNSLLLFIKT